MENLNFHIDTSLAATPFVSDTLKGGKTIVITFPEGKASAVFIQQSADGATWRTKHSVSSTPSATVNVEASSDTYLRVLVSERPQSSSYKDYSGGGGGGIDTEVDPTVPSWAKQPQKPTYTAAEVGAASKTELNTLSQKVDKKVSTINGTAPDEQGNINVATMTDKEKEGLEKALQMQSQVEELDSVLGMYTERASILLEVGTDNQVIDGSTLAPKAKSGWAISKPFKVERGNLYLVKIGQTDGTVVCAAQRITRTWDETDPDTGEVITHTEYSYAKKVQLNTGAELPKDGYLRILGLPSDFDIVISYNKATADNTIKVYRSGTLANICTQIGEQSGKWGVIKQVQTWKSDYSSYTMSKQEYGLIPQANIDLFLSEGAEFNGTGSPIEKTAPWGEKVNHLPGYFYYGGFGDISYDEMMASYNVGTIDWNNNCARFQCSKVRVCFPKKGNGGAAYNNPVVDLTNMCSSLPYRGSVFGIEYANLYEAHDNRTELVASKIANTFNNPMLRYVNGVLNFGSLTGSAATNGNTFSLALNLISIRIKNLKNAGGLTGISLGNSSKLDNASILYMIQNSAATTPITITLHPDAYARAMADDEILAALEDKPLVTLVSA